MSGSRAATQSPTVRLLVGLIVTMLAVAFYSWYTLSQLHGLRELQTTIIDRNRRDSLQLLRMQNDLSQIGLALRDMSEGSEPYGLIAYRNELADKRADLEDALQTERRFSPVNRTPQQQRQLENTIRQFWQTADQMFALAQNGRQAQARQLAGTSLSAQQSTLSTLVARLLIRNNQGEEEAAVAVAKIYNRVQRDIYAFLFAMLFGIAVTSLGLIYSNRRIFAAMNSLAQQRRVLAAKLITIQEEVLRSVSRELHDEFGQILTAVGAMLGRAERKGLPPDSPFRAELAEVRQITQETLEKMRSLSQMLHPTVLDDYGLVKGLDWYVQLFQKQTGIVTTLDVNGDIQRITGQAAIHCFRIVQEALNNAAKHAKTKSAEVNVEFEPLKLTIGVRDFGSGFVLDRKHQPAGLGLVAMRERAGLMRGEVNLSSAAGGGTLVVLRIPLPQEEGQAYLTQGKQETQVVTHD
jgi:signal transduction histidine kinase